MVRNNGKKPITKYQLDVVVANLLEGFGTYAFRSSGLAELSGANFTGKLLVNSVDDTIHNFIVNGGSRLGSLYVDGSGIINNSLTFNAALDGNGSFFVNPIGGTANFQLANFRGAATSEIQFNSNGTTFINKDGGAVLLGTVVNDLVSKLIVNGKGVFSDRLQAAYFKTNSAELLIPAVTWTNLFSAAIDGRYEVYARINGNNATDYAAIATVITEGGTSRIVANNATYLQLGLSGTTVQVLHQSTNPSMVYYSWLLITN